MRETMWRQPDDLRRLLDDRGPAERAAERIAGRRIFLSARARAGTPRTTAPSCFGSRGLEAWAVQPDESVLHGPAAGAGDALMLLSHRGTKLYTSEAVARASAAGAATVQISSIGAPGADIETCAPETSPAFTASHLCAILRLRTDRECARGRPRAPGRRARGRRRRARRRPRSTSRRPLACCSSSAAEPTRGSPPRARSRSARRPTSPPRATRWSTCCTARASPSAARTHSSSSTPAGGQRAPGPGGRHLAGHGAVVHRFRRDALGEPLSVFPLTTIVQRIALEAAERLGTNPDTFGKDLPGRARSGPPFRSSRTCYQPLPLSMPITRPLGTFASSSRPPNLPRWKTSGSPPEPSNETTSPITRS